MIKLSKEDIILANKIADRIRTLRIQNTGEKQIDFAKKYGIDKQLISRWEGYVTVDPKTKKIKGRGITVYTLKSFCKLIGISLKEFFDSDLFQDK